MTKGLNFDHLRETRALLDLYFEDWDNTGENTTRPPQRLLVESIATSLVSIAESLDRISWMRMHDR